MLWDLAHCTCDDATCLRIRTRSEDQQATRPTRWFDLPVQLSLPCSFSLFFHNPLSLPLPRLQIGSSRPFPTSSLSSSSSSSPSSSSSSSSSFSMQLHTSDSTFTGTFTVIYASASASASASTANQPHLTSVQHQS
jgi:hypothetical protein